MAIVVDMKRLLKKYRRYKNKDEVQYYTQGIIGVTKEAQQFIDWLKCGLVDAPQVKKG